MTQPAALIPETMEYLPLTLPEHFEDSNDFKAEFRKNILIQVQGAPVVLSQESGGIDAMMAAMEILIKYCPEVIFETEGNEKILIFSREVDYLISPKEVIKKFANFEWKLSFRHTDGDEYEINIGREWEQNMELETEERIEKILSWLDKQLKMSKKVILIGREGVVIFLLGYLKIRELDMEVWYQKSETEKRVRIT